MSEVAAKNAVSRIVGLRLPQGAIHALRFRGQKRQIAADCPATADQLCVM